MNSPEAISYFNPALKCVTLATLLQRKSNVPCSELSNHAFTDFKHFQWDNFNSDSLPCQHTQNHIKLKSEPSYEDNDGSHKFPIDQIFNASQNFDEDSGFMESSLSLNIESCLPSTLSSSEASHPGVTSDLLSNAKRVFTKAVKNAHISNKSITTSPSWAKHNLPGAGIRSWVVFEPNEIRQKFLASYPKRKRFSLPKPITPKNRNITLIQKMYADFDISPLPQNAIDSEDTAMKKNVFEKDTGSNSSKSATFTRRPLILCKKERCKSLRLTTDTDCMKTKYGDVLKTANNFVRCNVDQEPVKTSNLSSTTGKSNWTSIKDRSKSKGCDVRDKSSLDKSLSNIEWLEKLDCQSLKNPQKGGGMLTEQQLKKVQSDCGKTRRPPFSYMHLVMLAINSTTEKRMTLQQIYQWIQNTFPYFKYYAKSGWKNSIRHNLSLYNIFVREPIDPTNSDAGSGKNKVSSYWTIKTDKQGYRRKNRKKSDKDSNKKRVPRPIMPYLGTVQVAQMAQSTSTAPYMMVSMRTRSQNRPTLPGQTPILPKPDNDNSLFPIGGIAVCSVNDNILIPSSTATIQNAVSQRFHPVTSTPISNQNKLQSIRNHSNYTNVSRTMLPSVYLSPSFIHCNSNYSSCSHSQTLNSSPDSGIDLSDVSSACPTPHLGVDTIEVITPAIRKQSLRKANCKSRKRVNKHIKTTKALKIKDKENSTDEPMEFFEPLRLAEFSHLCQGSDTPERYQELQAMLMTPPKVNALSTSTPHKGAWLSLDASPKWGANNTGFTPLKGITPYKPSTPKNCVETPHDGVLNTPNQVRLDSSYTDSPLCLSNRTRFQSPSQSLNTSFGFGLPVVGMTPLRGIRRISCFNESFGEAMFSDLQLDEQLLQDNGAMPIDLGNLSWLTNADLSDGHLEPNQA